LLLAKFELTPVVRYSDYNFYSRQMDVFGWKRHRIKKRNKWRSLVWWLGCWNRMFYM